MVRTFNDRGSFLAKAHVSDTARPGVVVGLSIWWAKMCPGGRNANAVTGQELSDMGRGATFYDVLVEVDAGVTRGCCGLRPDRQAGMGGSFVAATVVSLVQFLRVRDGGFAPRSDVRLPEPGARP